MKMLVYLNDYKQLLIVLCLWLHLGFCCNKYGSSSTAVAVNM